VSLTN